MRSLLGAALAAAILGATSAAAAETRALTALDDARACTPLAHGGLAVATGGGLVIVRKDGSRRALTAIDGLPDTRVHAVAESDDGLWVGTEGGAALVALSGTPRVLRTALDAPVRAVLPDGHGVTLGTWGRGVYAIADVAAAPAVVPNAGAGKHVAALATHEGALHVAFSDAPAARLDRGMLRPIPGAPAHGQALASSNGKVVLGGIEGLFRIDPASRATSLASVDARGLAPGREGMLVATYGAGLLSLGAAGGSALRQEPGVPRWVRGAAVKGGVRCAATTEGLYVDEGSGWKSAASGGLPSNDVTTIAVDRDRVVIGTFDHGAAIERGGAIVRVRGLEPDETVNASAWQDGSAWLGTAHGLVQVDAQGAAVRRVRAANGLPSSLVRAVKVLSSGRLLVGTEEGAAFVDGSRVVPVEAAGKGGPAPLASPRHATWAVAEGDDGTIYLGTASGLYWGKDGKYARASLATGELRDDWVTALAVSPADAGGVRRVFAGTYSGGVTRLDFGAGPAPIATHLGGGYVNPDGLVLDGATLLAATMDGLLARPVAGDGTRWEHQAKAATGRDVTAVRRAGAALWIASRRGIAIAAP